jgi:predicted CXXCH cytochrome family protein
MVAHEPVKKGDCASCHDPHGGPGTLLQRSLPTLCFECHQNIAKFVSAAHKHEAVDDCSTCHGSHEAPEKALLVKRGAELCSDCHEVGKDPASRSVHAPFADGDCAGCHNPHGSDFPSLLGPRRQMVSTPVGPILAYPKLDSTSVSLCKTCHADEIEIWKGRTVQHLPAFNGECSACHSPHQSPNGGLLAKATSQLCQTCHDPSTIPMEPHHGINLASADCGQCHDPHASNQKGLLKTNAHVPFADGDCEACHTGPGSVTLTETQPALCLPCHEDMEAQMSLPVAHAPVSGGECTECHSPHASNEPSLLTARASALCLNCHDETAGAHRHSPYVQGQCLDCHSPHGSSTPGLLTKSANALCLGCHTTLADRLQSELPHAAVEDGCLVCHTGHASETTSLLKSAPSQLCATCHDTKTDRWRAIHVVPGTDGSGGDCMSCHDPHSSPPNATAMLKRSQHPPFEARECTSCHQSGQSAAADPKGLCAGCHDATVASIDKVSVAHAAVVEGKACLTCHSPHVGDTQALLKKTGFSVCTDCHQTINLTAPVVHDPAKEDCAICHTPHGGDNDKLLVDSDPMSLCTSCHEDATKTHFHPMGDQTKKPENRGLIVCTSCHSPHNSEQKALLLGDPTRGLCVRCHDPSGHAGG